MTPSRRPAAPIAPHAWPAGTRATARQWGCAAALALAAAVGLPAQAAGPTAQDAPALRALERLDVNRYLGTWYQVAWFPNRFQSQCVSDTAARYRLLDDGRLAVLNECRDAAGRLDSAEGVARPVGRLANGSLEPAQLEVSFLPAFLRWTGIGWGRYWVIDLADDYRYAVVSEPTRAYLWVLSRTPQLPPGDRERIRERLQAQGFTLDRWVDHPHAAPATR